MANPVTQLDAYGISEVVRNFLATDKSNLYGPGNLIQGIEIGQKKFYNGTTNSRQPNKMFILAEFVETVEHRMQNRDDQYTLSFKFRCRSQDVDKASKVISKAALRVNNLMYSQMRNGKLFIDYYSDSEARIQQMDLGGGSLIEAEQESNQGLIMENDSAYLITVNRFETI